MATLTITTTGAQDTRIVKAFGTYLGLKDGNGAPRNATAAEMKTEVINFIRLTVEAEERKEAQAAAIAAANAALTGLGQPT